MNDDLKAVFPETTEITIDPDMPIAPKEEVHIGKVRVVVPTPDPMDCVCVCPHCGSHVRYGEMYVLCGFQFGCPKCVDGLRAEVKRDRESDYESYVRKTDAHEYEPYRYEGGGAE